MSRSAFRLPCGLFVAALSILAVGCSDSSRPELGSGTIVIDQTPDNLAGAEWSLTGPMDKSGSGDRSLMDMVVGDYTLTWSEVTDYITPPSSTQKMTTDATIAFSGLYSSVGTIIIELAPDGLIGAGWTLSGPHSATGSSDSTLVDVPGGEYTLTWHSVTGWSGPSNSNQFLPANGTLTFSGTYTLDLEMAEGYVEIPPASVSMPATFTMGSTIMYDETPHEVVLTRRFTMSETEVTNSQYVQAVQWAYDNDHVTISNNNVLDTIVASSPELLEIGHESNEIAFSDGVFSTSYPERPVGDLTWMGAAVYCDWLSMQASLPRAYDHVTWKCNDGDPYGAVGYRLPTEAEWEFACRAGTTTHFNTGDCLDAGTEANYDGNHPYEECPAGSFLVRAADVRSYPANGWGLFEMHGNLYEWCNDYFGSYNGDETNPTGTGYADRRVLRGGRWFGYNGAAECRSAYRGNIFPHLSDSTFGIRPVRTIN